jgi:uncharacterized protein YdeI (YjbR/CyaY-like superfamily)
MKTYRFQARIESEDGGGAFVVFPYDVEQEFGVRGRVPVKAAFDGLSCTHRREYVRWITEAKRPATRAVRLAKAVTMLRDGVKTPG